MDHRESCRAFTFDGVFGAGCTQGDVYDGVAAPLLPDVLDGYEAAVLAYGQTGSGKTHSLLHMGAGGSEGEAGLFPRLVADLYTAIEADFRHAYGVEVSFCQVYNEQVDDLLRPAGTNLKVRAEAEGAPAVVDGLSWSGARSAAALLELFRAGRKRLLYAETVMNMHSSRSHAVLQLRVTKTARPKGDADAAQLAADAQPGAMVTVRQLVGRLTVVDLAGSERVKKSQAEGARLKEASNINTSLLSLGNCVAALAARQRHIPFRDSVLTRLLEGALGGRCRTALLCCVAPEAEHAGESTGALEFAVRAMRIAAAPQQNSATLSLPPAQLAAALGRGAADSALAAHGQAILRLEGQLEVAEAAQAASAADAEASRAEAAASGADAASAKARAAALEADAARTAAALAQSAAAREHFAALAAAAEAKRAEEADAASAALACAKSQHAGEAQKRAAVEAELRTQRGEAAKASAAADKALAAARADAASARAAAATATAALRVAWADATASSARYEAALCDDVAAATAAAGRQAARASAARADATRASDAFLAGGCVLPKTARNGKRLVRWFRWLAAPQRLEWAAKLDAAPSDWKGLSTAGATATLERGTLTLTAPDRSMQLHVESLPAVAWAQLLLQRLAPAQADDSEAAFEPHAGPPPEPAELPALLAATAAPAEPPATTWQLQAPASGRVSEAPATGRVSDAPPPMSGGEEGKAAAAAADVSGSGEIVKALSIDKETAQEAQSAAEEAPTPPPPPPTPPCGEDI